MKDDFAVFEENTIGMAVEMSRGDIIISRVKRVYNCTDAGMKTDARRAAALTKLKTMKSENCS